MAEAAIVPIITALSAAAGTGMAVKSSLDASAATKKQKDLLEQAKQNRLSQERGAQAQNAGLPGSSPGLFSILGAPRS